MHRFDVMTQTGRSDSCAGLLGSLLHVAVRTRLVSPDRLSDRDVILASPHVLSQLNPELGPHVKPCVGVTVKYRLFARPIRLERGKGMRSTHRELK